jgi:hypothetical protein
MHSVHEEVTMPSDHSQHFVIRFENLSAAEASEKAASLREALLDASPDVSAEVKKTDASTMDMGATLLLALGTPAIIAIAKGIAAFMARERAGTLVIEQDGRVLFTGNSTDAAKVAAALTRKA